MGLVSNRNSEVGHEAPLGYELAGHWQIELKGWALVVLLAGGTIVFGITIILTLTIGGLLRGYLEGSANLGGFFFPLVLGVFVAFFILHEAIHGVLFFVFGGKPRFGAILVGRFFPVAFYTTSKAPILRNQFLIVILTPFLTLTLFLLVIGILAIGEGVVALTIIAMVLNVSSSIGDLMTAWKIRRHSHNTLYEDTKNGFNWYVPSRSNL